MKSVLLSGQTRQGTPWVQVGQGPVDLLVLDGFRVDMSVPRGLALQGLGEYYKPYQEKGLTVLWLGRPTRLKEGLHLKELAAYLLLDLEELARPYRAVMATGIGGPLALAWADLKPETVPALILVSSGFEISESGLQLYGRLLEEARHFRWPKVHSLLARTVFVNPAAQALGAGLAWLFAGDLGQPEDPWDFLVTLQAEMASKAGPSLSFSAPLLGLLGQKDPLYDSDQTRLWIEAQPLGRCVTFSKRAQGLLKTEPEAVLGEILTFLSKISGAAFPGLKA